MPTRTTGIDPRLTSAATIQKGTPCRCGDGDGDGDGDSDGDGDGGDISNGDGDGDSGGDGLMKAIVTVMAMAVLMTILEGSQR